MPIIDNLNEFLGDHLKSFIRPGSKSRIAASTFSIFAFEALLASFLPVATRVGETCPKRPIDWSVPESNST